MNLSVSQISRMGQFVGELRQEMREVHTELSMDDEHDEAASRLHMTTFRGWFIDRFKKGDL